VAEGATRTPVWRGIEALGEAVGGYCWLERRVFELTGSWATTAGGDALPAEMRVFFAAASRRHGSLAERWAARLPVRAGVAPSALVVEPPGLPPKVAASLAGTVTPETVTPGTVSPGTGRARAASGAGGRLGVLVQILLPWLSQEYGAHLAVASPVCEAPVMEVLVEARRAAGWEMEGGRRILERLDATGLRGAAAAGR
jgi:hypothetical protein